MKIVQITDTHLFGTEFDTTQGVQTNHTLVEVVNKIVAEDLADTDLVLLTGDISEDESVQSYENAVTILAQLNKKILWIPGNHDHLSHLDLVLQKYPLFIRANSYSLQEHSFIFLNTKLANSSVGFLSDVELNLLATELKKIPPNHKIIIVMHHHPYPAQTPFMDTSVLKNADRFWQSIKGNPVELIICGHLHHDYHFMHQGVHIECGPSSCFQIIKGTNDFKIEKKIGYKVYHFNADSYRALSKIWSPICN